MTKKFQERPLTRGRALPTEGPPRLDKECCVKESGQFNDLENKLRRENFIIGLPENQDLKKKVWTLDFRKSSMKVPREK